jgi:hypothetical protein
MNAGTEKKAEPKGSGSGGNIPNPAPPQIQVHLYRKNDDSHELKPVEDHEYQCVLAKEQSPKSDVSLLARARKIRAKRDGTGSVVAVLVWKKPKITAGSGSDAPPPIIRLMVSGADVKSVTITAVTYPLPSPQAVPLVVPPTEDGWEIPGGSTVEIALQNLVDTENVMIQAKEKDNDAQLAPVTIQVSLDESRLPENK